MDTLISTLFQTTLTLMLTIHYPLMIIQITSIFYALIPALFSKNVDNIAFLSTISVVQDILAVTEALLNHTNKHIYQLPRYHSYLLDRTNKAHGGVTVFISNDVQTE